jgi:hypothetical protein
MKRSNLMKKLLCENGRETEWKREIERGTVVKTLIIVHKSLFLPIEQIGCVQLERKNYGRKNLETKYRR